MIQFGSVVKFSRHVLVRLSRQNHTVLNSGLLAKTCLQIVSYHLVAFWYHIRIRLAYI